MVSKIYKPFEEGFKFIRNSSIEEIWEDFNKHDSIALFQFIKYLICGVGATVIQLTGAYLMSKYFFPTFEKHGGNLLSDGERSKNHLLCNLIIFPLGNFFAYFTNIKWVFKAGRHSKFVEFATFTAIALFSFMTGLLAGPLLIKLYGIPSWLAQCTLMITSALVNFASRKYFIFHK